LRLHIPQENFVISQLLLVNANVKPASEGKQVILIPLKKTSKKGKKKKHEQTNINMNKQT